MDLPFAKGEIPMRRPLLSAALCALCWTTVACKTTTKSIETNHYEITDAKATSFLDGRLEQLQKRAAEYPQRPDLQYQIAGVHFEQGNYRDAVTHLEQAIALDPDGTESRYQYHLGRTYLRMGENALAEAAFERAAGAMRSGRYSGGHAALGFVRALRRDLPGAEVEFRRAIEIDPREPELHYFLAAVCDMAGKSDDAVKHFREYLLLGGRTYREKAEFYLERLGVEVPEPSSAES